MKRTYELTRELAERMDKERIRKLATPMIKQVRRVIGSCVLMMLIGGVICIDAIKTDATLSDVRAWVGPALLFAPGFSVLLWLWVMRILSSTKHLYKGLPPEFWGVREVEITNGFVKLVSPLVETRYSARMVSSLVETSSAVHLVGPSQGGLSLPAGVFSRTEVESALNENRPDDAPPLLPTR